MDLLTKIFGFFDEDFWICYFFLYLWTIFLDLLMKFYSHLGKFSDLSHVLVFHIHFVPRRLFITYQGQRLLAEDLNVAFLEPARETLRSRRRRAALSEVINELDDFMSDIDDK